MRNPLRALPPALMLALAALLCASEPGQSMQPTLAQAGSESPAADSPSPPDEERPASAEDAGEPSEEPAAEQAMPGPAVAPGLGETRRISPFDAVDDETERTPHPAALDHPDHDVVVCEAGCDRSAGSVVYKQKRQ